MLEPELLPVGLALLAVCVASYTDLKERIIPNNLTFPLIVIGVAFYAVLGLYRWDLWTSTSGALGGALAFAVGYAMWLTGGWAGGDVKLFAALGALLPKYNPPYSRAPYPFPFTILFNGIIAIAPILFAYIAISCARKPGIGRKIIAPLRGSARRYLEAPLVLIGCSTLASEIAHRLDLGWPLRLLLVVVLVAALYRTTFEVRMPIAVAFTFYGFHLAPLIALKAFILILFLLPGLRLLVSAVGVANREVLQEEVKITELREGMIPAETIYEKGGKVGRYRVPRYGKLLRLALRHPSKLVRPRWDRVLADPRVAAGVTRGQVRALRQLVQRGKLKDSIRVKKGMPFAPAFGLGVFISIFFGDIYWYIVALLSGLSLGL